MRIPSPFGKLGASREAGLSPSSRERGDVVVPDRHVELQLVEWRLIVRDRDFQDRRGETGAPIALLHTHPPEHRHVLALQQGVPRYGGDAGQIALKVAAEHS